MIQTSTQFQIGDLVAVRSPEEILQTLDENGTLNGLPFMPEMIPYCGKRYHVVRRVFKTCVSGTPELTDVRGMKSDDVVILEGLRCAGNEHDGCQKDCMILWREAWLKKPTDSNLSLAGSSDGPEGLRNRLKTQSSPERYFCQASEILSFTERISQLARFSKSFDDLRAGNCSIPEMIRRISIWAFWKLRKSLFGVYGRGTSSSVVEQALNLQPGECVIVQPMAEIRNTLDAKAKNRGLWFSPDMRLECGREKIVERRLEKIIVDGTGAMRRLKNTVYLKDSYCSCPHVAFGGCPRGEFVYWRETWLRRRNDAEMPVLDSKSAT